MISHEIANVSTLKLTKYIQKILAEKCCKKLYIRRIMNSKRSWSDMVSRQMDQLTSYLVNQSSLKSTPKEIKEGLR